MENETKMKLCDEIVVDWGKVAIRIQRLRMNNKNLRRYCCYVLKYLKDNVKGCDGECMKCKFKMDNLISQDELAEVLKLSGPYVVSNWENGRSKPTVEDILRLCDISQITVEQLLGVKGQEIDEM